MKPENLSMILKILVYHSGLIGEIKV